jgi:hypothetical protein
MTACSLWLSVKYLGRHKGGAIRDGIALAREG